MQKLMAYLGVTKETTHTLNNLVDFLLGVLVFLILLIDWDKTLELWGL